VLTCALSPALIATSVPSASENRRPAVVTARGLRKLYDGRAVVDGIDLAVSAGECFGILGPNGAGKTTTLRMLLGTTPPTAGSLEVLGFPVPGRAREMRRLVGVVPQADNLDPDFTVTENLIVYGGYFAIPRAELQRRIPALLAFAALEAKKDAGITSLSGGMRRRLTLARALVNEPELLVLDEPTTGLDPQARQLIWQRLRALLAEGKTLILTTHYMEEAERLCDRLVILDDGKILVAGSPAELVRAHIEPQVIEVYGRRADEWHERCGRRLSLRTEKIGETVFCYAREERPLVESLYGRPELHFLHRPANLEDVFLKLTGRELRDG
jgi:lipooligosaccharide transport system ATP-binding protein